MTSRFAPIVGHPYTKVWPRSIEQRSINITIWEPASGFGEKISPNGQAVTVLFTYRRIMMDEFLNPKEPFEFLAPANWTNFEALWCAFTGEQPKGKEVYNADDDA